MKKYKITNYGLYGHYFEVQMKTWYGWIAIKTFKANDISPDSIDYAQACAQELLDILRE